MKGERGVKMKRQRARKRVEEQAGLHIRIGDIVLEVFMLTRQI